jgi:hypothetical protein
MFAEQFFLPTIALLFGDAQKCGGPMQVIERLTAVEIQLRSPPGLVTAAA